MEVKKTKKETYSDYSFNIDDDFLLIMYQSKVSPFFWILFFNCINITATEIKMNFLREYETKIVAIAFIYTVVCYFNATTN